MSASFRTISFSFEAVRGQEVCWRSSVEGQQNCELKVGDGVGALSSLRTVYLTVGLCRLLRLEGPVKFSSVVED